MDSIKTSTGNKEVSVERDGKIAGVISFNPSDIIFAEKFYGLIGEFENKLAEYQARNDELDADKSVDGNNVPVNLSARLSLLRDACEYIRGRIDHLFGIGTSQIAFGDALNLDMFEQFFNGITPFVQSVRADKIAQYTTPAAIKRRKRKPV